MTTCADDSSTEEESTSSIQLDGVPLLAASIKEDGIFSERLRPLRRRRVAVFCRFQLGSKYSKYMKS